MIHAKHPTTILCLILMLIAGSTPTLVRADERSRDEDKPVRLHVSALMGPIGKVESFDAVTINGLIARGDRSLWGGEMIQAPAGSGAQVWLDSVGQVTFKNGAAARLATSPTTFDDASHGLSLVASLAIGDITVRLKPNAAAYVEAGGSVFTASSGSAFKVGLREGGPVLEVLSGNVQAGTQTSQAKFIRPLGRGLDLSIKARGTRQLQVRVTDENDKPLPDVPVVFSLGGGGVGSLSAAGQAAASTVTVTSGANGVATVSFTAAATPATGTVTAAVPGTTATATGSVNVGAAVGLSTGLVAGITAVAVSGTVAAIAIPKLTGDKKVKEEGPTVITPNSVARRTH
ncbi:MAG: hypothetical protein ACLGJB_05185 [Blastocatellia bacterium]